MLEQGITLTIAGMATVFTFLLLLVLTMSLCSRLVMRLKPETPSEEQPQTRKTGKSEIAAAIAIAAAVAHKKGKL